MNEQEQLELFNLFQRNLNVIQGGDLGYGDSLFGGFTGFGHGGGFDHMGGMGMGMGMGGFGGAVVPPPIPGQQYAPQMAPQMSQFGQPGYDQFGGGYVPYDPFGNMNQAPSYLDNVNFDQGYGGYGNPYAHSTTVTGQLDHGAGPKPVGPTPDGPKPVGPTPDGPKPVGPTPTGPKPSQPETKLDDTANRNYPSITKNGPAPEEDLFVGITEHPKNGPMPDNNSLSKDRSSKKSKKKKKRRKSKKPSSDLNAIVEPIPFANQTVPTGPQPTGPNPAGPQPTDPQQIQQPQSMYVDPYQQQQQQYYDPNQYAQPQMPQHNEHAPVFDPNTNQWVNPQQVQYQQYQQPQQNQFGQYGGYAQGGQQSGGFY